MSFHESGRGEEGRGGGARGGVFPRRKRGDVGSELVAKESKRFPDMLTLPALVSCIELINCATCTQLRTQAPGLLIPAFDTCSVATTLG